MKSWDLSDLALDAPPPSDTAVAALPSGGSAASSSGTSPALFSTPATTATGSTGGCLLVWCQSNSFGINLVNCFARV